MKKTLQECYEQYAWYSGRYCDAHCNHETEQALFYSDKLFDLVEYAKRTYDVDLNDVDLSDII